MTLDERLIKDIKRKPAKDPYYEDEPDYEGYIEHEERRSSLNEYQGVFVSADQKAINRRPSVFDRTAVFKVTEDDE